ncbi:MAG: hypothetical protein IJP64_04425 [Oscillospiraceae bacterium]|nr:hypothetical protein [Oscillospiraceae bacterium]
MRLRKITALLLALLALYLLILPTPIDAASDSITISRQPAAQTSVFAGNIAQFSVTANGSGTLTYQWESSPGGEVWASITRATSAKTSNLRLTASESMNGMKFRCRISDSKGNTMTSSASTLTVLSDTTGTGPSITVHPKTHSGYESCQTSFTVSATGSNLRYQWQVSSNGESWSNLTNASSAATSHLVIKARDTMNDYQFRCIVTSQNGSSISNPATLTVLPNITRQPDSINTFFPGGGTLEFRVKASGTGLTYQWIFSKDGGSTWYKLSGPTSATMSQLIIHATADMNHWMLRCLITNAYGKKLASQTATITFFSAILVQPESVAVAEGENAVFNITARGADTIQWQYRSPGTSDWSNIPDTILVTSGSNWTKCTILAESRLNGYEFRCVIMGLDGKELISDTAMLTVQ